MKYRDRSGGHVRVASRSPLSDRRSIRTNMWIEMWIEMWIPWPNLKDRSEYRWKY
jgi:hypothetical protein